MSLTELHFLRLGRKTGPLSLTAYPLNTDLIDPGFGALSVEERRLTGSSGVVILRIRIGGEVSSSYLWHSVAFYTQRLAGQN